MMLAASHLSGAYRDYLGEGDNNLATSAVYAQEEDIQNQLVWGVRYRKYKYRDACNICMHM